MTSEAAASPKYCLSLTGVDIWQNDALLCCAAFQLVRIVLLYSSALSCLHLLEVARGGECKFNAAVDVEVGEEKEMEMKDGPHRLG